MILSKRIRDCRYAKGWGPDELATRAEISRTALYQIESGKTELPRASTLRRIARALDVSIDVLLGNSEVGTFELSSFAQPSGEDAANSLNGRKPGWDRSEEAIPASIQRPSETFAGASPESVGLGAHAGLGPWSMSAREHDLSRKFHEILASPLGEGVARIVEESHRLLPQTLLTRRLG